MKYTIEAIENAKPGMRWEEIGCQWTLGQAYLYSKEAGNDLPNFAEVIWDYDIEAILEDCRKLGVKEFTISSTFSSLIETMENRHYLGDDFYPAIIDQETYDKAAAIRLERAGKLGRLNRKKNVESAASPTGFRMAAAEQHYEDPRLQAEYLYSLIESEVS